MSRARFFRLPYDAELRLGLACRAAPPLDSPATRPPVHAPPPSAGAVLLEFLEQQPGSVPCATRTVVTGRYLRLDFGPDAPDFLLYTLVCVDDTPWYHCVTRCGEWGQCVRARSQFPAGGNPAPARQTSHR
jgi:hypothetical protein